MSTSYAERSRRRVEASISEIVNKIHNLVNGDKILEFF